MDRFFHHVLRGLVAVLGLGLSAHAQAQTIRCGTPEIAAAMTAIPTHPTRPFFEDEGKAFAAINSETAPQYHWNDGGFADQLRPRQIIHDTTNKQFLYRADHTGTRLNPFANCAPSPSGSSGNRTYNNRWAYVSTCATRAQRLWAWEDKTLSAVCDQGCRVALQNQSCSWRDIISDPAQTIWRYECVADGVADGQLCSGPTEIDPGPRPPEPEPEPDPPDDPVPPDDPDPPADPPDDPPEEPEPDDGQDDGQQVSESLGPKLDAIEQAVLGLGPKIDDVKQSVDGARADANTDADRIVDALGQVRNAIGSNAGGGEGEGEGPVDLSPLTPGQDGGQHPTLDDIVEEGDASQLLAQLDTDGWGFSRSCPANSWTQSFDLGFGTLDVSQVSGFACLAGSIIGWMLALAGMIQAAYILGRMGMS